MSLRTIVLSTLVLATGAFAARAALQQGPMVRPGPEHAILKNMEGTWDAEVDMAGMKEKGTMTTRSLNGLWVLGDFQGSMRGMPFTGHNVMGWDTLKKKYVATWVDSISTAMSITEGTWDAATKTMTMSGEGTDMATGQTSTMYSVTKVQDADHHTFSIHPGSATAPAMMTIAYTRKK
jgi:uncharacterized protein DUF1579